MLNIQYEKTLFNQGYKFIGAIDEAGRGPLAGPVVAACVIITPDFCLSDELKSINDSKKLSAKKRAELCVLIKKSFLAVGIGICDHNTIDRINILEASFLAMKKAISGLKIKPAIVLLDGKFSIPNFTTPQIPIIKGDSLIFSIAAASIVAKTARDQLMEKMHDQYPEYLFNKHKGYGTKIHLEKIKEFGPCPIHRKSFAPIKNLPISREKN